MRTVSDDELRWYLEPPESSAARPAPRPPDYRPPATGPDPLAVAAAATGALPILPPLGIILGLAALRRIHSSRRSGRGLARAGVIGGSVWSLVIVASLAFVYSRQQGLGATRDPAGSIVRAGRVATSDLRSGDCLANVPAGAGDGWVQVASCAATHTGQVYDVRALADGPYPGESGVQTVATAECGVAWHEGVAAAVRDALGPTATLAVLVPTAAGWAGGDRGIACVVATPARTGAIAYS